MCFETLTSAILQDILQQIPHQTPLTRLRLSKLWGTSSLLHPDDYSRSQALCNNSSHGLPAHHHTHPNLPTPSNLVCSSTRHRICALTSQPVHVSHVSCQSVMGHSETRTHKFQRLDFGAPVSRTTRQRSTTAENGDNCLIAISRPRIVDETSSAV